MKPIRLHRQTVQGVQTHTYKNRTLRPARYITTPQPVWSVTTTSRSVTGKDYQDSYHYERLQDAVTYITIMARGDHSITHDTWQTLSVQLSPKQLRKIEEDTGQVSSAAPPPQQADIFG